MANINIEINDSAVLSALNQPIATGKTLLLENCCGARSSIQDSMANDITDARWTDQARAMVEAGEYRYLSPTFTYDANNGKVTRLVSVALTNMPALNGLADLAAATEQLGTEPAPDLELARTAERFNHAFAHLGVQYSADEITATKHNAVYSPGEPFANDPVARERFEWAFPGILK